MEADPDMRGGVPVIKDTRLPVALVLADIRDSKYLLLARRLDLEEDCSVTCSISWPRHLTRLTHEHVSAG